MAHDSHRSPIGAKSSYRLQSMYDDVVAQSGDEIFVGSSTSGIPSGFAELSKSY